MTAGKHRILALALVALLGLTLTACGNKRDRITEGSTEGTYVDVGSLKYQVQISRQLNPRDIEDRDYLLGLPKGTPPLADDEVWFGVFMRVENAGTKTAPAASDFEIIDTQNTTFRPTRIDAKLNPFAYTPVDVGSHSIYPNPTSAAGSNTVQGNLLLFRLKLASLPDRPLDLVIKSPELPQTEAVIKLDV